MASQLAVYENDRHRPSLLSGQGDLIQAKSQRNLNPDQAVRLKEAAHYIKTRFDPLSVIEHTHSLELQKMQHLLPAKMQAII